MTKNRNLSYNRKLESRFGIFDWRLYNHRELFRTGETRLWICTPQGTSRQTVCLLRGMYFTSPWSLFLVVHSSYSHCHRITTTSHWRPWKRRWGIQGWCCWKMRTFWSRPQLVLSKSLGLNILLLLLFLYLFLSSSSLSLSSPLVFPLILFASYFIYIYFLLPLWCIEDLPLIWELLAS